MPAEARRHSLLARLATAAVLLGAAVFADAAPLRAEEPAAPAEAGIPYGQLSEEQKIVAIDAALRQGRIALARAFLEGTAFTEEEAKLKALFLYGGLLKSEGRLNEAAAVYRELLTAHPDFDQVRTELAHTLYLLGDDEAARHHFELLSAAAVGVDSGETFRRFIEGLDARRPFSARLSVSLAPGTNVNSGTDATQFSFGGINFSTNPESRRQSGIGLKVNGDAAYTWRLGRLEPYLGGGLSLSDYKGSTFDDLYLSGRAGGRLRFGTGLIGLEAVATRRFFAGDPYSWEVGPRIYARKRVEGGAILQGSFSAKRRRHDEVSQLDSWVYATDARLTRALSPALTIAPELSLEWERVPDLRYFTYREIEPGISLYWEGPFAVTAQASAALAWRDYGDTFPGQATARHDQRLTLSLALLKRDWQWRGFAPVIGYTFTNNDSNVVLYEYDRHDFQFTITRKF